MAEVKNIKFKYLYRLLNSLEDPEDGLTAKDQFAMSTLVHHVAYGSRGREESQYISTCSNYYSVRKLANLCLDSTLRIVRIDVEKLCEMTGARVIDLTTPSARQSNLEITDRKDETFRRADRFASNFSEVVIEGHVPSCCVQLIYTGSDDDLPTSEPST
ncbi:hypothetical protein FSP39_012533 [Pinctada imbricata]|uniref:Uncharacterized protein n=1 Tax=Pinctada imbricata TaxID=66713 RepID=A0AA89BZP0_PINIB|nr:hypothetical protein FSP39_012533 [Pinctada imbricata]